MRYALSISAGTYSEESNFNSLAKTIQFGDRHDCCFCRDLTGFRGTVTFAGVDCHFAFLLPKVKERRGRQQGRFRKSYGAFATCGDGRARICLGRNEASEIFDAGNIASRAANPISF